VKACRDLVPVESVKWKHREGKTRRECVANDMWKLKLQKEDALNLEVLKRGILIYCALRFEGAEF